jgi:TolA-binding protein
MSIKRPDNAGSAPNREELYQMATEAAKSGQTKGARVMFRQLLQQDKRDIRAMMWLAKLANSDTEREAWLERVVSVRPSYTQALEMLEKLRRGKIAKRNKRFLQVGSAVYVVGLTVICLLLMISAATAP